MPVCAEAAAVRALTLSAAEIYGVADRVGSIEPGKIANLLMVKGQICSTRKPRFNTYSSTV